MKENVSFIKKIVIIAMMFLFVIVARSYAAVPINIDSIDSYNFSDIIDSEESTAKASDANKGTTGNETTPTKTTASPVVNKNSTSASKENIPATGSNAELIFIIGTVVLIAAVAIAYKKQSIKLK